MRIIWGVYAALGVLWLAVELNMSPPLKNNPEPMATDGRIQVALGLLLLSVGAASLAEERVRGSLDILLSNTNVNPVDPGGQVVGDVPEGRPGRLLAGPGDRGCSSRTGTRLPISC